MFWCLFATYANNFSSSGLYLIVTFSSWLRFAYGSIGRIRSRRRMEMVWLDSLAYLKTLAYVQTNFILVNYWLTPLPLILSSKGHHLLCTWCIIDLMITICAVPKKITHVHQIEFIKNRFKGFDKDSSILSWLVRKAFFIFILNILTLRWTNVKLFHFLESISVEHEKKYQNPLRILHFVSAFFF